MTSSEESVGDTHECGNEDVLCDEEGDSLSVWDEDEDSLSGAMMENQPECVGGLESHPKWLAAALQYLGEQMR